MFTCCKEKNVLCGYLYTETIYIVHRMTQTVPIQNCIWSKETWGFHNVDETGPKVV